MLTGGSYDITPLAARANGMAFKIFSEIFWLFTSKLVTPLILAVEVLKSCFTIGTPTLSRN